jgi:hypothetical protein
MLTQEQPRATETPWFRALTFAAVIAFALMALLSLFEHRWAMAAVYLVIAAGNGLGSLGKVRPQAFGTLLLLGGYTALIVQLLFYRS